MKKLSVLLFVLSLLTITSGTKQDSISGAVLTRVFDDLRTGGYTEHSINDVILDFKKKPNIITGDVIDAIGNYAGSRFVVDSYRVTIKSRRLDKPLNRRKINHSVAILATHDSSVTESKALDALRKMDTFYNEVTRGYDRFKVELYKKYSINYKNYCDRDDTREIPKLLIRAMERDGYDSDQYDHIINVVPKSCGKWSGAWAYVGRISDSGSLRFQQVSVYKDNVVTPWFFAHEIGHNLGMLHARSMDCGSGYYRSRGRGCDYSEYGNYNDNMGNGEGVYYSGPYQRYLGWIDGKRVVTVGKTSTFNLQPIDSKSCGIQALRVPITGERGNYFYVEYRRERSSSKNAGIGRPGDKHNGVLVTKSIDGNIRDDDDERGASGETDRVEVGRSRYEGIYEGKPYTMGNTDISIKFIEEVNGYAVVNIETPGSTHNTDDYGDRVEKLSNGRYGSTCGGTTPPPPDGKCSKFLEPGEKLKPGEYRCSLNGKYRFGMSKNGDLRFVRVNDGSVLWSANTCCHLAFTVMRQNGNLEVRGNSGRLKWESKTYDNPGSRLYVTNDGRAVIRDTNKKIIWSTR